MEHIEELRTLIDNNSTRKLKNALAEMNNVDIAECLNDLPNQKTLMVFRLLSKDDASEVFSNLDSDLQQHIIEMFNDEEVETLMQDLFLDDTVDFLEEVPASVVKKVLKNCNPKRRQLINRFLKYPEDSAGSLMTIEFVDLYKSITVATAIERIRALKVDSDNINTLYIKGPKRALVGTVPIHRLLTSDDDTLIEEITDKNFISVSTDDDRELIAEKFRKYDLTSIPVTDKEDKLVGIITIDDIIDVIDEENTEDFEKMAAMTPSQATYLKTSSFSMAKNRILWLLVLMVSATITGNILTSYKSVLESVAVLTAFIPMLMDTGGNCGAQSSTLIIRGLALGELTPRDILKIMFKELRVAMMVGLALVAAFLLKSLILPPAITPQVAIVVSISLFLTVVIAKLIGSSLPIAAQKLGLDPALMASPFITTIVDACSLFI
ncbi:MAG: magnesium transporter, partial [Clostridia bacterium]|nr:magnesium transporter [Clostridia bacterium]